MQVVRLIGVVQNGDAPSAGVPVDTRAPLELSMGVKVRLQIAVLTPSGAAFDLTGKTVKFEVKRNLHDDVAEISVSGTPALARGRGQVDIDIPSDAWNLLSTGSYLYDVWVTDAAVPADREPIIASSPLSLLSSVLTP